MPEAPRGCELPARGARHSCPSSRGPIGQLGFLVQRSSTEFYWIFGVPRGVASDARRRSFEHLFAVNEAVDVVAHQPAAVQQGIGKLLHRIPCRQ